MGNRRVLFAAIAGAALVAACSSSSSPTTPASTPGDAGAGSCPLYKVPASTDTTSPASLKTDVMPILTQSCVLTKACHAGGGDRAFLSGDSPAVHAALVGVASVQLSTMPYVTPGDATKSYLMHKMDGDQCAFDPSCLGGFCQSSMPSSAPQLDVQQRDIVRRWISQGAKDN